MEQFRSNLRREALELALNVKRIEQDLQYQFQATARLKESVHDDIQERVKSLEERLRHTLDHEVHVSQTIDRNTHSQCASINAIMVEQEELRKIVEDLAGRLDRSQETSGAAPNELSTNALLEINDLKSKVGRLTEQNTKLEGDVSYLSSLSDQVNALWKCLPPGTSEEGQERVVTAVEVQDEMDDLRRDVYRKIKELSIGLNNLCESVQLIERDKDESWEAVSHKVSTLVENSVGSLTERLTELEHTVQSQGTTPVTDEDVLDRETWSTLEQVIWSELNKVKEQAQQVPDLYTLCGELYTSQKTQERQISGLRSFARRVEQFLAQLRSGAVAPRESVETRGGGPESNESLGYVPGVSASSSNAPTPLRQSPTPPRMLTPQSHSQAGANAPRTSLETLNKGGGSGEPLAYVPGASVSSPAMSANVPTPTPPTCPAPPIPTEVASSEREAAQASPRRDSPTRFSTVRSEVRSGAIRIDITNPEQWTAGDVAVIRNQEAKKVRDIGSLTFETPIRYDYEAGVEVRSLLPTEQLEEIDGRLAILDVDPVSNTRFVKFWVDEIPIEASEEGS